MCEKCCQCDWEEGQTVISEVTEDGLICSKCKGFILFVDSDPELPDFEDLQDFDHEIQKPDPRTVSEMDKKIHSLGGHPGLWGSAALSCDHCGDLIFWKGPDHVLQQMIKDLRDCDVMPCPKCHEWNEITDKVREMLDD